MRSVLTDVLYVVSCQSRDKMFPAGFEGFFLGDFSSLQENKLQGGGQREYIVGFSEFLYKMLIGITYDCTFTFRGEHVLDFTLMRQRHTKEDDIVLYQTMLQLTGLPKFVCGRKELQMYLSDVLQRLNPNEPKSGFYRNLHAHNRRGIAGSSLR